MSSALLKKSLEIVDSGSSKRNSSKKKSKNLIPESHKIMRMVKKKGKMYKQNQIEGSGKKITITDVQNHMKSSSERIEKTVDKLLKLHSSPLDGKDAEEIARRAKTRHYVLPPQQEAPEPESVFTEEDFKRFEEEYFDDTI